MLSDGLNTKDSVNRGAFERLLRDLRHPPRHYPRFSMLVPLGLDDNGNLIGDIISYLAAQKLTSKEMHARVHADDVLSLADVAREVTGLSARQQLHVEVPLQLIKDDYPLYNVTADDVARVVEEYINSGFTRFDWSHVMPDEVDEDEYIMDTVAFAR